MGKINSIRQDHEKRMNSITETLKNVKSGSALIEEKISNISSRLEEISSSFPPRDKESVNENDSKDDELDVAQFGPGRE